MNILSHVRFANPKPLSVGNLKDYYATREANECLQPDYWDFSVIKGSEDCLYLYVYTPIVRIKFKLSIQYYTFQAFHVFFYKTNFRLTLRELKHCIQF